MFTSILVRMVSGVASGFVLALAAHALLSLAPGDPAESIAVSRVGATNVTPQLVEEIRRQEGLDRPFPVQAANWLGKVFRGDLGKSSVHGRSVARELAVNLAPTIQLALASTLLAAALAVLCTLAAAMRPRSLLDRALGFFASVGVALPGFWLAQILILLFAVRLRWLPATDDGSITSLLLPSITVALPLAALGARLLRGTLADVIAYPYIRAARARGFAQSRILWRHALPNAILASVPLYGVQFAAMLEGTVIVESIFNRPGCGRLMIEAVFARDYPVIQGCLLLLGCLCVLTSTAVQVAEVILAHGSDASL